MEAKDVMQYIRQALGRVKEQNQGLVSVAALEHYLDELEKHVDKTGTVINVALFQAEHERNLAHYEAQRQHLGAAC